MAVGVKLQYALKKRVLESVNNLLSLITSGQDVEDKLIEAAIRVCNNKIDSYSKQVSKPLRDKMLELKVSINNRDWNETTRLYKELKKD